VKEVILVSGGKGGVGKSTAAKALLDYFIGSGSIPFLIETDAGVPDVFRSYGEAVPSVAYDLRSEDGWIDMLNVIDECDDGARIVVNTAARAHEDLENFVPLLQEAVKAGIKITWLFMIGRNRDSMEILSRHLKLTNNCGTTHVVLNGREGPVESFNHFNESQAPAAITKQSGLIVYMPSLSSKFLYEMDFRRLTFDAAFEQGRLGDRAALTTWRNKVKVMFDSVFIGKTLAAKQHKQEAPNSSDMALS
jgi:hypothetical protein